MGAGVHEQDSPKIQGPWKTKARKVAKGVKKAILSETVALKRERFLHFDSHSDPTHFISANYGIGNMGCC